MDQKPNQGQQQPSQQQGSQQGSQHGSQGQQHQNQKQGTPNTGPQERGRKEKENVRNRSGETDDISNRDMDEELSEQEDLPGPGRSQSER